MGKKGKQQNIRVIKDPVNPETPEVLAASLIKIADGFERLMGAKEGLTQAAIVALLMGMPEVKRVSNATEVALILDNLAKLKGYYVRKAR